MKSKFKKGGKSPQYLVLVKKSFGGFAIGDKIILSKEEYRMWEDHLTLIKVLKNIDELSIIK